MALKLVHNDCDPKDGDDFRSGAHLLAAWNCETREQKLERACMALMEQLERSHLLHENISLARNLTDHKLVCSCADAYRMGHEALDK